MRSKTIRWLIVLGTLSIIGIIAVQWYWVTRTLELKESEFHQSASIALKNVATKIAKFNKSTLSHRGLITRVANNYYIVNVNSDIDANVLEAYLIDELYKQSIDIPFEYGIYDCQTNELVYGNCCNYDEVELQPNRRTDIQVDEEYVYYFVVRFPSMDSHILSDLPLTIFMSLVTLVACLIFVYAMYVLLAQKRFSELQRDFINNITHEFKTPLSSIKLAAESFMRNDMIKKDDRLFKYATIIRDQNQHLNLQVEKVLNLAKLELGNIQLNKESLDLNTFIQDCISDAKVLLEQNDGSLELQIDDPLPIIDADPFHLKNVILNLVENGIKYSEKPALITLTVVAKKNNIFIKIKDKGIGIEKNNQAKLFDKFYRVSTGNVHNAKGFGLGLYYVKMIVDAHKWVIDVNSEINKGSEFSIIIPQSYV